MECSHRGGQDGRTDGQSLPIVDHIVSENRQREHSEERQGRVQVPDVLLACSLDEAAPSTLTATAAPPR